MEAPLEQLDVQGCTAVKCGSNVEPEEFLEVLNSDPAFVEASFLNTGKTQLDLNDALCKPHGIATRCHQTLAVIWLQIR